MARFIQEIKDDLDFIRSHRLQPRWFKVFKIFLLAGFLAGYALLFGLRKTAIFFAAFLFLMLLVHLVYRVKTNKFRQSWLDFVVVQTEQGSKPQRIGKYYYGAIVLNALLSFLTSQWLGR